MATKNVKKGVPPLIKNLAGASLDSIMAYYILKRNALTPDIPRYSDYQAAIQDFFRIGMDGARQFLVKQFPDEFCVRY